MPTKNGSVSTGGSSGYVASLSWSHTVAAGSNRCLVVGVVAYATGAPTANTRTVTWNSQSLTRLGIIEYATNEDCAEIWYLKEASLSNATANVVVTAVSANQQLSAGAQLWDGVDQTTTWGTFVTASGTSAAPSVTPTTVSGDEAIDILGYYDPGSPVMTPTYTVGWEREIASQDCAGQSSRTASGASTQIGWTLSASRPYWYGAAALKAAGAATSRPIFPSFPMALLNL